MGQVYNIEVVRGLSGNRSLLSCGTSANVDLWNTDDGSGRQQWVVDLAGDGTCTIKVAGGTTPGRTFLGLPGGNRVDLVPNPQSWTIVPTAVYRDVRGVPGLVWIRPAGADNSFLSCVADGTRVDIWGVDDDSGRQRWQLQGPFWVN